MLIAALLAVGSAVSYGVSDYFGTVAARRLGLIPATALGYLVAVPTAGVGLLIVGGAWSWSAVLWSGAAAVATIVGLLGFFAAMVRGPASVVSPLIAVLGSAVPVAGGLIAGERLGWLTWAAIGLAIAAAFLMSVAPGRGAQRLRLRTLAISIVSGLALGVSVVFLDRAPPEAGLVPAFVDIVGGFIVVAAIAGATWRTSRASFASPRRFGPSAVNGVLLGLANVLLVLALRDGDLAVVGVLVSLYPLATILLALLLDRERPSATQWAGIGGAIAASVLFAVA
jgi:uncharacterized membrane protein